jgi:hypothetical protein
MKTTPELLYKKIQKLSNEVKKEFRNKGIVLPKQHNDGSVSIGRYRIIKHQNTFYSIADHTGEVMVDKINLPQTAALLANGLELGRWLDNTILQKDRTYGYALFEETLYRQHADTNMKKDIDRAQVMLTKSQLNRVKKESCKRDILQSFEKLRKIV